MPAANPAPPAHASSPWPVRQTTCSPASPWRPPIAEQGCGVLGDNVSLRITLLQLIEQHRHAFVACGRPPRFRHPGVPFAHNATRLAATDGLVNFAYACTAATRTGSAVRSRATCKYAGPARRIPVAKPASMPGTAPCRASPWPTTSAIARPPSPAPANYPAGPSALTQSMVSRVGARRATASTAGHFARPCAGRWRNSTRAACETCRPRAWPRTDPPIRRHSRRSSPRPRSASPSPAPAP